MNGRVDVCWDVLVKWIFYRNVLVGVFGIYFFAFVLLFIEGVIVISKEDIGRGRRNYFFLKGIVLKIRYYFV